MRIPSYLGLIDIESLAYKYWTYLHMNRHKKYSPHGIRASLENLSFDFKVILGFSTLKNWASNLGMTFLSHHQP